MNLKSAVFAAASLGAMLFGIGPGSANDVGAGSPKLTSVIETGYVTTQGRGRGFRRGGGGGAVFVAPRRRNNFGRNVAIGVGAAVVGGIIANEVVRSRGGGNSCSRWSYQCDRGIPSSCRNLDRYC